jgi:hypothetical protein
MSCETDKLRGPVRALPVCSAFGLPVYVAAFPKLLHSGLRLRLRSK